jgi:hypothetical protein
VSSAVCAATWTSAPFLKDHTDPAVAPSIAHDHASRGRCSLQYLVTQAGADIKNCGTDHERSDKRLPTLR